MPAAVEAFDNEPSSSLSHLAWIALEAAVYATMYYSIARRLYRWRHPESFIGEEDRQKLGETRQQIERYRNALNQRRTLEASAQCKANEKAAEVDDAEQRLATGARLLEQMYSTLKQLNVDAAGLQIKIDVQERQDADGQLEADESPWIDRDEDVHDARKRKQEREQLFLEAARLEQQRVSMARNVESQGEPNEDSGENCQDPARVESITPNCSAEPIVRPALDTGDHRRWSWLHTLLRRLRKAVRRKRHRSRRGSHQSAAPCAIKSG